MTINEQRSALVVEARSWVPTVYHRRGVTKHVGADCGSFLGCVLSACGLIPEAEFRVSMDEIRALSDDWFMHEAENKYVELMSRYVPKIGERMTYGIPGEPPGNIILMQTANSKRRNHGAFVTAWPKAIHCCYDGVEEINILFDPMWSHREISVYDPWAKR